MATCEVCAEIKLALHKRVERAAMEVARLRAGLYAIHELAAWEGDEIEDEPTEDQMLDRLNRIYEACCALRTNEPLPERDGG